MDASKRDKTDNVDSIKAIIKIQEQEKNNNQMTTQDCTVKNNFPNTKNQDIVGIMGYCFRFLNLPKISLKYLITGTIYKVRRLKIFHV